jgi:hypothetical protein
MSDIVSNAASGNYKAVRNLLDKGESPQKVVDGWSPIHAAASKGQKKVLSLLISFGATVMQKDVESFTALHYAARYGHSKCVEILLENGATSSRNSAGDTPCDLARTGRHLRIAKKLQKEMDMMMLDPIPEYPDFLDSEITAFSQMNLRQSRQSNVPSIKSEQYSLPSTIASIESSNQTKLREIKQKCEPAYNFWVESFGEDTVLVPIERFLFALEMFNADRIQLPPIRLKEMDPGMFYFLTQKECSLYCYKNPTYSHFLVDFYHLPRWNPFLPCPYSLRSKESKSR